MEIRKINQEDNSMQATLTRQLADASDRYYNGKPSSMQDTEFDRLYDQLAEAERISGFMTSAPPSGSAHPCSWSLRRPVMRHLPYPWTR